MCMYTVYEVNIYRLANSKYKANSTTIPFQAFFKLASIFVSTGGNWN